MDQLRAITSVRREWVARSRGPTGNAVLERLMAREPDLAAVGARSLVELFAALQLPPARCPVPHWDITSALIRQFGLDELVGLGLLSALVPGLIHVARSLDWGRGGPWDDAEAFAGDLLATAWTVLATMSGRDFDYPERRVLSRVRRHLGDQRARSRRHDAACSSLSATHGLAREGGMERDWEPEDGQPVSVLESLAIALGRLRSSKVPPEDVRLLFEHRVLGYSLAELATRTGEKPAALKYRRRRVESLLCAS